MKRLILLFAAVAAVALSGCSKDENNGSQTIMLNTYYTRFGTKTIASPTLVLLYDYSVAKNIDIKESVSSLADYAKITLKDGTKPSSTYSSSPNFTGINTFENVPTGEYMAIVFFKPEGYSFTNFFFYGYKKIIAKASSGLSSYDCIFHWEAGNSDAGEFIEF